MTWRSEQNRRIDESLVTRDAVFRNPFVLRRIWGHLDEIILQHHVYNALAAFRPEDEITIVDIGCGGGELIHAARGYFPRARLVGIDDNQKSIERARELVGDRASWIVGSYADIFAHVQQADLVFCSEVFEHVDDVRQLLDALFRLVKPGGYLSISTPSGWMWWFPSLSGIFKMIRSPRRYRNLYLKPEKHWSAALSIHPAVRPKILERLLSRSGFIVRLRRSALWRINEYGIVYRLFAFYARKRPFQAARTFESYIRFLDALLNMGPFFRALETRIVVLAQRKPDRA